MMADGDAAQDAGIGIDGDVIFDDGMAGYVEHIALCIVLEAL